MKVYSYIDVLRHNAPVGENVAVIGAGGIGFDISDYLTHFVHGKDGQTRPYEMTDSVAPKHELDAVKIEEFMTQWGVDTSLVSRSGLLEAPAETPSPRKVYLLQRGSGKPGMPYYFT